MSGRRLGAVAVLVVLLLAGVASYYASTHPDGLEAVAERTGFAGTARDSATSTSPLADYETRGVEDQRFSGGLAGVIGVVVVLVIAGGLFRVVRRSGHDGPDDGSAESAGSPQEAAQPHDVER